MRLSFDLANILGAVYHRGSIIFGREGNSIYSPVGNKIVVYDLKANKSLALPLQVNYNIHQLCIHPNGTLMLAASEKSHLYMVSLVSGKLLHYKEYKSFTKITHLSFSPDGRFYCVAGENLVLIYVTPGSIISGKGREITPFRLHRKLRVNHDTITDASWSSDSNLLCIASQDISLSIISLIDKDSRVATLRGHSGSLHACYFANKHDNDRQVLSLSKSCQLFIWDEKNKQADDDENDEKKRIKANLSYYRSAKHFLKLTADADETKEEKAKRPTAYVTASDYNSTCDIKLLVLGYNTGHYSLYEMPSATLIYSLDSRFGSISTISINRVGDWIAFGSSVDPEVDATTAKNKTQSRLWVWEWQSKLHVLDQIGSGASMANMHECSCYSFDGMYIVSGNYAGRIKVWSCLTGEIVATFGEEHIAPIKSIKFVPNKSGQVILSASLDGTIRAYDLNKFKNFRTFQSPVPEKLPNFICLDVDSTGEFIAAGTYNYFEIYLFSLQTGKFLEYLSGHEGPVSGVAFSPITNLLTTCSWDCTVRIWNLFEGSKCQRDSIVFGCEAITLAFRPDGQLIAVSLSNGQIAFINPHTAELVGAPIEGVGDLGATQLVNEAAKDSKKFFLTISFSADGTYLIAGGKSNFVCIYHVQEKILVKKFALTFNMSMDGVFDYISNRKRREFGYNLELLESRMEEIALKPIQLPGVRKGDLGDRQAKPVIAVCQIAFSPTMRSFVAATTEGVLIYSLDISKNFEPFRLTADVDPVSVRNSIKRKNYCTALVQAVQLNEKKMFAEVIEKIPLSEAKTVIHSLDVEYVKRILEFLSRLLPSTKHIEFYLVWIKQILYKHGLILKNTPSREITPTVRALHQNTSRYFEDIKKNCDFCKYSLQFFLRHQSSNNRAREVLEDEIVVDSMDVSE